MLSPTFGHSVALTEWGILRQKRMISEGILRQHGSSMLCEYFNNSPHAVRNGLEGEDGLVRHWTHRQDLELRICEELFWDRCTVLPSKLYGDRDIRKLFG